MRYETNLKDAEERHKALSSISKDGDEAWANVVSAACNTHLAWLTLCEAEHFYKESPVESAFALAKEAASAADIKIKNAIEASQKGDTLGSHEYARAAIFAARSSVAWTRGAMRAANMINKEATRIWSEIERTVEAQLREPLD